MRHARIDTPAHHVWVEARPAFNGNGKDAYYAVVKAAASVGGLLWQHPRRSAQNQNGR